MRLLTFAPQGGVGSLRLGALVNGDIVDLAVLDRAWRCGNPGSEPLPATMRTLLAAGEAGLDRVRALLKYDLEYDASKGEGQGADWRFKSSSIRFYPPLTDAEKFLCVGKNYRQHLEELRRNDLLLETPQEPTSFVKYNYCLSGHGWDVQRPEGVVRLDYEPELVFVIGRRALGVRKAEAFNHVAGVTILNDLTCRDLQRREVASGSRFWTGKNIPGFGPLGPWVITMDEIRDPYDLWMTCTVNGEQRMRFNTGDQIWRFPEIIEHFSRYIPFEPGDMFATGTPGGTAIGKPNAAELFLKPGDVVECGIEGMMTLRTHIVPPT
ncbi:MAG: fumarylacetoacetate hydrolase family protein [Deltaproteobacteria bacterium]|nr:fumarylacetoacetate hydrolase family protein [Deltaproteobacteria bacterium]